MKRPFRLAASAVCLTALLSACGGGTSSVEAFTPDRVIAFGDDLSALTATGNKYTVNALKTDGSGAIDCEANPLWIQTVASVYGYRFAECLGTATEARAKTWAAAGAKVADVRAQIDAQAALGFTAKDLVTVMVGENDIREIYESRSNADSEETLLARARDRGIEVGNQVNRLVELGPKVIVATVPDIGLSPYGLALGTSQAALLSRMTQALNGRIRVTILNDGRYVGLVLADEMVQSAVQVPSAYGLTNVTAAVCLSTVPLPNCTTDASSLVEGGSSSTWLWADNQRLGSLAHVQLGNIAASRARSNPF